MTWPHDLVQCDQSQLEAPDVDRAQCPSCGADLVIAGTPRFPRWPAHCQPAPDVDLGAALAVLHGVDRGDWLEHERARADTHVAEVGP